MEEKEAVVKITVRLPAKVHAFLQTRAKQNQRSLNGELVWALRQYYGADDQELLPRWVVSHD